MTDPGPRHTGRTIAFVVAVAVVVLCASGWIIIAVTSHGGKPPAPIVPAASPAVPSVKVSRVAAAPSIAGDDVVHVGEDVPAGTYRAVTPVTPSSGCYWVKSSDPEAKDIITNGLPSGGRPEVVLKAGQWFTSNSCPTWVKR